ncbi:methyltransferase domain-containing protein [Fragilaria crotonensis]|nr:methyltransferase domain-containing protein [Fragilaria crotonensis]
MLRSNVSGVNTGTSTTDEERDMVAGLLIDSKDKARRPSWMLPLACIASFILGFTLDHLPAKGHQETVNVKNATTVACSEPIRFQGVPTFMSRNNLGSILEKENMTVGVELGVQRGYFSSSTLDQWPSCKEFHLVDLWAHQENYHDFANFDQAEQNNIYDEAIERTKPWKDKIHVCRNYTSVCVKNMPDGHFDYIYVDARHDFKGVYEDLRAWWPKLREGGIMAGHDYVTQDDGPEQGGQDWTTNYDGTKDETRTVVKGAVDKFAMEVGRQLTISYREDSFNTWAMRK